MGFLEKWKKRKNNNENEPASYDEDNNNNDEEETAPSSTGRKNVTWAAAGLDRSATLKSESSRHYQELTAGKYGDKTYSGGRSRGGGGSAEGGVEVARFEDSDDEDEGRSSGYYRYRRSGKNTNSTIDSRRMTSSYMIDGMDDDGRGSTRSVNSNSGSGARVLDKLDALEHKKDNALEDGNAKRAASADRDQAVVVLGETVLVNRETLRALKRTEKDMNDAESAGQQTLQELQRQLEVMYRVDAALDLNDTMFIRISKDIRTMFRKLARDKCMVACCCTICLLVIFIVIILIRKVALGFSLGSAIGFGDGPAPSPPDPTLAVATTTTSAP